MIFNSKYSENTLHSNLIRCSIKFYVFRLKKKDFNVVFISPTLYVPCENQNEFCSASNSFLSSMFYTLMYV